MNKEQTEALLGLLDQLVQEMKLIRQSLQQLERSVDYYTSRE